MGQAMPYSFFLCTLFIEPALTVWSSTYSRVAAATSSIPAKGYALRTLLLRSFPLLPFYLCAIYHRQDGGASFYP